MKILTGILFLCAFLRFSSTTNTESMDKNEKSEETLSEDDLEKPKCSFPLGMEHGNIQDSDIKASSSFAFKSVGPQNARIRQDKYGGAWCPKEHISEGVREWIEIDLRKEYRISRTGTQGRFDGGRGQEYAEMFMLEYWRKGMSEWAVYKNHSGHDILPGNKNTYLENVNLLNPPIIASKVRFVPHSKHPRTVCMRVELYGCAYETGLTSYSAPPGDEFSPRVFLSDIYDGIEVGRRLVGGLGLLTDGRVGELIEYSQNGIQTATGWVGWKNRKRDVVLIFEFNSVKEFSSVTFVTYANKDMGIRPFSHMVASFSDNGARYRAEKVTKPNKRAALELSKVDSVQLSLDGFKGRYLKLQLFFTDKWILLSEISFELNSHSDFNGTARSGKEGNPESEKIIPSNSVTLSDTPRESDRTPVGYQGNDNGDLEISTGSDNDKSSSNPTQVYIGLIIGVLGVTVLLLLVTIAFMMRRNKQKIFNKHSLFKSPNINSGRLLHHPGIPALHSNTTSGYAQNSSNGIISLRDLKSNNPPTSMYGGGLQEDSDDGSSFYHEPYRLILKPTSSSSSSSNNNNNPPKTTTGSSSCGRLCEYEEFGLLEERPQSKNTQQHLINKTSLDKSSGKFGSTPMFPPPPVKHFPPSTNGGGTPYGGNGYATTGNDFVKKHRHHIRMPPANENFYAATDILGTDLNAEECDETLKIGDYLKGDRFTPMLIPGKRHLHPISPENDGSEVTEYARRNLRMIEKIGQGSFGMAHLCEASSPLLEDSAQRRYRRRKSRRSSNANTVNRKRKDNGRHLFSDGTSSSSSSSRAAVDDETAALTSGEDLRTSDAEDSEDGRRVVVRSLWITTPESKRQEFLEAVRRLSVLNSHPNFAHILAVCTEDDPICVLSEYSHLGDLRQFLKGKRMSLSPKGRTPSGFSSSETGIDSGVLLYMATQICSGMKFLEKLGFVHRDLATRNCLIDASYCLKISDFAMFCPMYSKDYYQLKQSKEIIALRWIPWEVYIMGAWSVKSDVWSFGVTLWEIFNETLDPVFSDLSDDQVCENLNHWFHSDGFHLLPSMRGLSCSKEMQDLMIQCWSRDPEARPKFSEMHLFLQNKSQERSS